VESPEPRIPRAQARREMVLSAAVVAVVVGAVMSQGFWLGVLERLDAWSATAIVIVAGVVLIASRRRAGARWAIARGAIVGAAIGLTVIAMFFGVCVATQCIG